MKSVGFVAPNFRCRVSRTGSSRRIALLDYAATADELGKILEDLQYEVHAIEPYDFEDWRARARQQTLQAIAEYNSTGKVTFNASLWGELKHHLFRLFDGQCAYCEVKVTDVDPGSVEHYRPKGRVEEAPDHPGYYWLAYNERNWFPACPLCNEVAKRSHFPIAPNSPRAYKQDDEGQERPMLLTPYDVDLDRDFEFVFAKRGIACMIVGKTERAKETIRVCGLDRGELSISRGEQWLRAQQDFLALVLVNGSFEKAQRDFDATARRREFSSVCRAAVQRMSA